MIITFSWNQSRPVCQISDTDFSFKKDCIINFLNDDEGLGLNHLKAWIKKGLIEVEKINTGKSDFYDMWGQAWGAEISREEVTIYWGYSETDYTQFLPFDSFYILLKNWSNFLESGNNKYEEKEFKI